MASHHGGLNATNGPQGSQRYLEGNDGQLDLDGRLDRLVAVAIGDDVQKGEAGQRRQPSEH